MRDTDQHTLDQYHAHMAAIGCILTDWRDGSISIGEKRRRIAEENKRYYKEPVKSSCSNEYITSPPRASERNEW
jgi:hypothetical protein